MRLLLSFSHRSVWIRQSPKLWQDHFATVMENLGFRHCKSDSNLYCHKSRSLYVLAYVDDLLIVGDAKLKKEFIDALSKELLDPTLNTVFWAGNCVTTEIPLTFSCQRSTLKIFLNCTP